MRERTIVLNQTAIIADSKVVTFTSFFLVAIKGIGGLLLNFLEALIALDRIGNLIQRCQSDSNDCSIDKLHATLEERKFKKLYKYLNFYRFKLTAC